MDVFSLEEELKGDDQLSFEEKIQKCDNWLKANKKTKDNWEYGFLRLLKENFRQGATIFRQGATIAQKSLVRVKDKFPCLLDRTASGVNFPENQKDETKNYEHANVVEEDVSSAISSIKELMDEYFWNATYAVEENNNCDSETGAQFMVVALLNAVLRGLQLNDRVEVAQHRTLAGVECDIILIYKPNRLPFAALEVKKPGEPKVVFEGKPKDGDKGGNRIAGQVLSQLNAIQLFGFDSVVGMLTTGNQWRIMGLPVPESDGDPLEAAVMMEEFGRFRPNDGKKDDSNVSVEAASPAEAKLVLKPNAENEKTEEAERKLWAGKIVPLHYEKRGEKRSEKSEEKLQLEVEGSGEEIVSQLVLFVTKACSILSNFLKYKNPGITTIKIGKMPCRILDFESGRQFSFGTITLKKLNLQNCIGKKVKKIHVFHHLGMGNFGNVCLATTREGASCCAVKFYHSRDKSERISMADEERKNWNKIYKNDYSSIFGGERFEGKQFLVMPYLDPILESERHELLKKNGSIEKTLNEFAKSGYIHKEIKWRHFRRWTSKGKILLIDLGTNSLEEKKKRKDRNSWIKESIAALKKKAPDPQTKASPSTPPTTGFRRSNGKRKLS